MLPPATARSLEYLSWLLGFAYMLAWSVSFYPQLIDNYRRKSTSGTTPKFPIFNVLGFTCYSFSQLLFFCSPLIQEQYRQRNHGKENMVRWNDLLFALNALVFSCLTLSMFWPKPWGFEKRVWRVGRLTSGLVTGAVVGVATMVAVILIWGRSGGYDADGWAWIDVVNAVNTVKLVVTVVKYVPQVWTNYMNKSTAGWNIVQILLDFVGGVLSIAQLAIDASLQGSVSGVMGNPIKFGLGNVSIFFDVIFMVQHYILYTKKAAVLDEEHRRDEEGRALLGDGEVSEGSKDGEESDLLTYRQEDEELRKDGERRGLLAGRNSSSSSGSSTIRGG